ncbi:MAG: hypothetical protein WD249_08985 [Gaiellaceae bacterium]
MLIGGVAERALGSPRLTEDLDICPSTSPENLRQLAAALNDLKARFRIEGEEPLAPPEPWYDRSFGAFTSVALATRLGRFDVWFRPDGTGGYDDLIERAIDVQIGDNRIKVAHLDDIIRNKQATGGAKYLSQLPLLRELQRIRRQRGLP